MDINQEIALSENKNNYKSIDVNKHLFILNYKDYGHIYKGLQYKDSYIYADENDSINIVIKLNNYDELKNLLHKKRFFTVNKDIDGPIIEIHTENSSRVLKLKFSLNNSAHLFCIKQIFDKKYAYIHFVSLSKTDLIKNITCKLDFDDILFKYLKYTIDYCYYGTYPQIDFNGYDNEHAFFIEIEPDISIIAKLSMIVTCLQKWGSQDCFDACISWEENMKIFFSGSLINKKYIENEISKKYRIISKGSCKPDGIPCFRYEMGRLYYFKRKNAY